MIRIRRIYDERTPDNGVRYLVDRLWPRGVRKADAGLDAWLKSVSPSHELRKRYHGDASLWEEFVQRYHEELDRDPEGLETLLEAARGGDVTLLYAARDTERNNAVALKDYLERRLGIAGASGV